jgi:hypothetical protein
MDLAAFRQSLTDAAPPPGVSPAVQGLWWDGKGDWHTAHACAQERDDAAGAVVHAYLHRKEGDLPNARYWYARAGRPPAGDALAAEWERLATELLAGKG